MRQWVRVHAKKKRKANMKVKDCMNYINTELFKICTPSALTSKGISWSTARAWLHRLGFMVTNHKKGTFKDGHDDIKVIEYRQHVYLPLMEKWRAQVVMPADFLDEKGEYNGEVQAALTKARARAETNGYDKIMLIPSHDECSFNSNEAEGWHWGNKDDQNITSKSRGALINVSDYANIISGWLALTDEQYKHAKKEHNYDGPQEAVNGWR